MNDFLPPPEQAWHMVLDQLRPEMAQASFNTWVRDTEFIAFENGVITIGSANEYGSEWLTSRLTSTATRLLTGILNQLVTVQFIVHEETNSDRKDLIDDELIPQETVDPDRPTEIVALQAEYQSVYDEIVQPEQVIVVPGYFLRYIPMLGPELSWLYIGFRQAAYEAGASRKPGKKVGAPAKKVAWYAGMSPRSFWRWVAKPNTWKQLRWLVKPIEETPVWHRGSDGRPHQATRYYRVSMSMPLTPFDERSLKAWIYSRISEGKNPLETLRVALEVPLDELIPWPDQMPSLDDTASPHSVQDVLKEACSPVAEGDQAQFRELADKLAQHLMPSKDLIFLTHYFVTHWLARLGPGPGWFVTLMRDRCYLNQRTGEIRDEVRLEEGYAEAARWLGLKRIKTIWEWLRDPKTAIFLRETGREEGSWDDAPRRIQVCLGEPMIEEDQERGNLKLANLPIGASVTHRELDGDAVIGASVTHSEPGGEVVIGKVIQSEPDGDAAIGASVTHREPEGGPSIGASCKDIEQDEDDAIGASGIHGGATGIQNGASGTGIGASGTQNGASVTPIGASDIHKRGATGTIDWRDWHSLNSLTPIIQHLKNTQTTSTEKADSNSDGENSSQKKGVVAEKWNLPELLSLNRISPKNQELLLSKGSTPHVFISWLLYAASKGGSSIRDPVGHAVSRLIQDPAKGAGGVCERLARLPARDLKELLRQELEGQGSWNADWRSAMEGTPRTRLRALADQLGVRFINPNYG